MMFGGEILRIGGIDGQGRIQAAEGWRLADSRAVKHNTFRMRSSFDHP
jgi:hypothetical protein